MSTKEIKAAALKLPRKARIELGHQLLESASTESQREIDAAWAQEVERRIDNYNRGKSKSRPVSEFLKELRGRRRNGR